MRINKRRVLWIIAFALVVCCITSIYLLPRLSRINQSNFDRIQDGMNQGEVRAILGSEEKNFVHDPALGEIRMLWREDLNFIAVDLIDNRVVNKKCVISTPWESLKRYVTKTAEKIGLQL